LAKQGAQCSCFFQSLVERLCWGYDDPGMQHLVIDTTLQLTPGVRGSVTRRKSTSCR
jgi:hypothetical protein